MDNSQSKQAKGAVWYHGGCADGFTGAYAAWKYYGDRVSYSPIIWGDPLPKLTDDVLFLDIIDYSLSLEDFKACQNKLGVDNFLILDHHLSAKERLGGQPGFIFDINKSGAMLAHEHYFPNKKPTKLFEYIQDADLYNWKLKNSHEIYASVFTIEFSWENWQKLESELENNFSKHVEIGQVILNYEKKLRKILMDRALFVTIAGHKVPAINNQFFKKTDAAFLLENYPDYPFVAVFSQRKDGEFWSLRSNPKVFDVSQIAKQYGGGGHPGAAGFCLKYKIDGIKRILV